MKIHHNYAHAPANKDQAMGVGHQCNASKCISVRRRTLAAELFAAIQALNVGNFGNTDVEIMYVLPQSMLVPGIPMAGNKPMQIGSHFRISIFQ